MWFRFPQRCSLKTQEQWDELKWSQVPFGGDSPAIDDLGGSGNRTEVAHASSVTSSVTSSPKGGGGEWSEPSTSETAHSAHGAKRGEACDPIRSSSTRWSIPAPSQGSKPFPTPEPLTGIKGWEASAKWRKSEPPEEGASYPAVIRSTVVAPAAAEEWVFSKRVRGWNNRGTKLSDVEHPPTTWGPHRHRKNIPPPPGCWVNVTSHHSWTFLDLKCNCLIIGFDWFQNSLVFSLWRCWDMCPGEKWITPLIHMNQPHLPKKFTKGSPSKNSLKTSSGSRNVNGPWKWLPETRQKVDTMKVRRAKWGQIIIIKYIHTHSFKVYKTAHF